MIGSRRYKWHWSADLGFSAARIVRRKKKEKKTKPNQNKHFLHGEHDELSCGEKSVHADPPTTTAGWLSHHLRPKPTIILLSVTGTYSRLLHGSFSYFSIELIFNYLKYGIFIFY